MTHPNQPDIHQMITELTHTHIHRERYAVLIGSTTWTRHHSTTVPALITQLLGATPARSSTESGTAPVSKPAARIEALDTVILIDDEAGHWIDQLGGTIPSDRIDPATQQNIPGSGTLARLHRLHGLHPSTPTCNRPHGRRDESGAWCCDRHHLEHDVQRWWHQARIITGWDIPAYRPYNTCPVCEHRGGLRINVELEAGFCIECRSIWDRTQIGLLAEHIRAENTDDLTGRTA